MRSADGFLCFPHRAELTRTSTQLDSAFQLQEHLAALHYYHTSSHTAPISRDTAKLLATPPPGIDKTLWLYELCRFLIAQCNSLIVGFLFDTPPCSAATCPEMRAGEWQFLCAVHDTPKSCCAIDYCCHTLDWAANVVTNPKIFPSRFVVDAHDKNTALKNLVNVFRRLHRIFAHAWFQHRGVFWSLESQSGLYVFFKTVCDVYDLLPAENYKLPPEAEGLDSSSGAGDVEDKSTDRRHQPQHSQLGPISIAKPPSQRDGEDGDYSAMSRTNTRRHIKSSPSVGSAVTTVPEADEDESTDLSNRLGGMRISSRAEEEGESASIPVIVEHRPVAAGEQPIRPSSVIPPSETATTGSQPKPSPEPEAAKQDAEPPVLEDDFAPEPELQSHHEHVPVPDPEPQAEEKEAPSAVSAEEHQPTDEQHSAAAASEKSATEAEDTETETESQATPSTATSDEASGDDAGTAPEDAAADAADPADTEEQSGKSATEGEKEGESTTTASAESTEEKEAGSASEVADTGSEVAEEKAAVESKSETEGKNDAPEEK